MKHRKARLRFQSLHTIQLSGDERTLKGVHLTKIGNYHHRLYGDFSITDKTLSQMQKNFDQGTFGQKIFIDVAHKPEKGAAAEITNIYREGQWLLGDITITNYGRKSIKDRHYIYLSVDYEDNWIHPETKEDMGAVLFGAGLTIRPFIKGQPGLGVTLAEPTSESILKNGKVMKFYKLLQKYLTSVNAGKNLSDALLKKYKEAESGLANNADKQRLLDEYKGFADASVKQLAELSNEDKDKPIQLSINTSSHIEDKTDAGKKQLADTTDIQSEVKRQLAEAKQSEEEAVKSGQKKLSQKVKLFNDRINASELDDVSKKQLCEDKSKFITKTLSDTGIEQLADGFIDIANTQSIQRQLSEQGFEIAGSPRISVNDSNAIKSLQETVDKRLGLTAMAKGIRYQKVGGDVPAANKALAEKVLADYDRRNGQRLFEESKQLADASGTISDVAIPGSFERTVVREALHNLIGLQFVNAGTADFSESHSIHYSYRKKAAAGVNDTRVYEAQGIPRAGVVQTSDIAYPIPQKLSFEVSDELRYLTSASNLNWEAVSENQANASRIIGEDTDRLLFNEQVQSADEYRAFKIINEDLAAQVQNGVKTVLVGGNAVTTICRPRKEYNLKGVQIGTTKNELIVNFDGNNIAQFNPLAIDENGASTLVAGNYFVLDYDIGEIFIVDKDGNIVDPAGKAWKISYSKATNVAYFDTDVPVGVKEEDHWNKWLTGYSRRKTLIEDINLHNANFGLMSGNYMTEVEQARKFEANSKVPGTDLSVNGNLGRVKDVSNYKTQGPGLWIGDRRALLGERNVTRFRMMKSWTMGQLENQKNAEGNFTGQKEAYGDQFIILKTPEELKDALTSIIIYSKSARKAR